MGDVDEATRQMHLRAGAEYGRAATCGSKVDYKSEETADAAAAERSIAYKRKMEAYPCFFCNGWHIGRAMTEAEIALFQVLTPEP